MFEITGISLHQHSSNHLPAESFNGKVTIQMYISGIVSPSQFLSVPSPFVVRRLG